MMSQIAHDRPAAAIDFSTIESLRDGRRVEIRALRPADLPALMEAIGRMSANSMSRRFFGAGFSVPTSA